MKGKRSAGYESIFAGKGRHIGNVYFSNGWEKENIIGYESIVDDITDDEFENYYKSES